ncbi:alpha/beta fold hydrolase [Psychrobacter sp. 72-O-c]|uniref:alpha/beta fold hydrolase n=1 Tax=Psychrobacter sp. 72-O-c TaxID=2774125 RepID=UPI00223487F4|nr:alpha/beta hydrolase [Psychrobacter sp. 72-O-c]
MMPGLVKVAFYICISIFAIVVATLAFFWAPDRSVAELKQWQLPNSEFIDVQGMQVHVVQSAQCEVYRSRPMIDNAVKSGKKLPEIMVLLHGTSASVHTWEGWTAQLSDEYCVVSMDLPGFGLTGPYIDKTTEYTSANYAAFVVELLDTLRLDRVILAGNSLGGGNCLAYSRLIS